MGLGERPGSAWALGGAGWGKGGLWLSGARGAEPRQQMERDAALGAVSRAEPGLVILVALRVLA